MVLESLEQAMRGPKTEAMPLPRKLTIEHILPQQWATHWPLRATEPSERDRLRREQLLHTIGNLTLLTSALNPAASNAPWSEKRTAIQRHSILMLNKAVTSLDAWDDDGIRRRGESLFALALRLWPRPQGGGEHAVVSYADVGREFVGPDAPRVPDSPVPVERIRCPIPGCVFTYEHWPMGWDGHVGGLSTHSDWQPELTDPNGRREVFRKEFAAFIAAHGGLSADRAAWEARADPASLGIADAIAGMLGQGSHGVRLTYNRGHIAVGGAQRNFAWMHPKKTVPECRVDLKNRPAEIDEDLQALEVAGLSATRIRPSTLQLLLRPGDVIKHRELLHRVFERARVGHGDRLG
jgi:hypothetical protein